MASRSSIQRIFAPRKPSVSLRLPPTPLRQTIIQQNSRQRQVYQPLLRRSFTSSCAKYNEQASQAPKESQSTSLSSSQSISESDLNLLRSLSSNSRPQPPPSPSPSTTPSSTPEAASTDPSPSPSQLPPTYALVFTCKSCSHRSAHHVSKQGYHAGTVLIQCPSCKNRHLISDHLKIFRDEGVTLDDILREKGDLVRKMNVVQGEGLAAGAVGDGQGDLEFIEAPKHEINP